LPLPLHPAAFPASLCVRARSPLRAPAARGAPQAPRHHARGGRKRVRRGVAPHQQSKLACAAEGGCVRTVAKSEMNLINNFLYHPKFFWRHPSLEEFYTLLERYLHIPRRINAINHRLNTLNEIFDMFNSYLENRHSTSLELIIIALIAIEIIFGVLNFHF
jgi:hypothetical protein